MESKEAEAMLQSQATIWQFMYSFADSMALKSVVELRIADIIHSHDGPVTLAQIASRIDGATSPDITCLARIMRLLVRRKLFTVHHPSDGGEPLYGLTHSSRWLLHDSELSLAPMILMENHPWQMAPWHYFSQCVREGGTAFKMAHGCEMFEFASGNPQFNDLFNDAMTSTSKVMTREILSGCKEGFSSIGSLVDVGGGTGGLVFEIVKAYPHIKGTNFDLPHVIEKAPTYPGVCHIGGDMFESIPKADAVIMKFILHDWSDEDCIKILKNCRNAIPAETGKVILVECVLQPDGSGLFDDVRLIFDLLMLAHCSGGKERTELEWKKILKEGGFPRYKIINIPALPSIIEAYPIGENN
ncbi:desmethylxanthohumol 6'-O-methyltransferase-like [Durio zibethinus]|uniref:Desmethylxanthohumol 6'-O-methyltransferase-like n=1 Tax=Durio zibethinus TaxID=66656 RepID=A0A6P6A8M9_DURZI|nr:desmethylxanthohumol 6'-O-methyltransferase-like [Durio zibethinus]